MPKGSSHPRTKKQPKAQPPREKPTLISVELQPEDLRKLDHYRERVGLCSRPDTLRFAVHHALRIERAIETLQKLQPNDCDIVPDTSTPSELERRKLQLQAAAGDIEERLHRIEKELSALQGSTEEMVTSRRLRQSSIRPAKAKRFLYGRDKKK